MGLTNNQQQLIQAISKNDMLAAKKSAVACLNEDKTVKNKHFVSRYKQILESGGANMLELPYDLKNIMCVEDVSSSFKLGRYYLSEREKRIFEDIKKMKKVNERLMELGIPYLNSTLLHGESGTGKTTFAKYVACKMQLPLCYLKFSDLVDSHMGTTSKNISKAFSYVISNPCVFMLDEIDCISIRRSNSSSGGVEGEMARITITLMQEFDKLTNDIVVLGATNRIDRIDEALLRRFSSKHEVKVFNESETFEMAKRFLKDVDIPISDDEIQSILSDLQNQSQVNNKLIRYIAERIAIKLG